MAATRKTKAAGKAKTKTQDQVQDQPEFKQIQKSASPSVRDVEALGEAGPSNIHASPAAESALAVMSALDVRKVREDPSRQARRMDALVAEIKALREKTGIIEKTVQNIDKSVDMAEVKARQAAEHGKRAVALVSDAVAIGQRSGQAVMNVAEGVEEVAANIGQSVQHQSLAYAVDAVEDTVDGIKGTVDEINEAVDGVAQESTLEEVNRNVIDVENKVDNALSNMAAYYGNTHERLLEIESSVENILELLQTRSPIIQMATSLMGSMLYRRGQYLNMGP
ncbi:hypothetical protein Slin15195_G081820 [Septoria linicola]|uniref:Uncharacterized protein n=1 Tax=Septoria linicola TaxID=215465 RepID=A0A9Q9AX87_9PEZI|nr:hypothetical protein Slin15195_G081820 [Septoria linicola]